MRIITIIASLLLLTMHCGAEPYNIMMGPYYVSFDLGPKAEISTIGLPEETDTETQTGSPFKTYDINIKGNYSEAQISISNYRHGVKTTPRAVLDLVAKQNNNLYPTISDRWIDGHLGAICDLNIGLINEPVTTAVWILDNYSAAYLSSTYPWDEGTLSLLKTIHIENTTA